MKRTAKKQIAGGIALAGLSAIGAYALLRPRMRRWGATDDEVASPLPGDELVVNANYVTTLAVTIHASPAEIWPWLVQMGYRRGGLYSYDWLDRAFGYLDAPSADEILPQFQQLRVGDAIPLGRGPDWPVVEVERERALVLEPVAGVVTWAFMIVPMPDDVSRLLTRVRFRLSPRLKDRLTLLAIDPTAFVMTRKMLLGIKRRAEALAHRHRAGGSLSSTSPAIL